jgi:integrase
MKQPPSDNPDIDDLFEYYYAELRLGDAEEGSVDHQKQALGKFQDFLEEEGFYEEGEDGEIKYLLDNFGRRDAKKFLKWLKYNAGIARSTGSVYAIQAKRFCDFYNNIGVFHWNPIGTELENFDFDVDNHTDKKDVSVEQIKEELNETDNPLTFVIVFLLAKWGIRRSELANLDLHDIHLDHPLYEDLFPDPRSEIAERPDTVYISSQLQQGREGPHGEVRKGGNKRVRSTKIPIDQETKQVLIWYVTHLMPVESPAEPLIRSTQSANNLGERMSPSGISDFVKRWARERGWNETDQELDEKIHAHWFRHLFTTELRKSVTPEEIGGAPTKLYVKGLRGDSGEDVIDTYTHGWGDYTREAYTKNIYKLLS